MADADDQHSILEAEYRFRFKNGGCYALAAALHEQTGLAIGSVIVDWRLERHDPSVIRRSVAHAYVLRDDGRAVDIDGESALDDLLKRVCSGAGKVILNVDAQSFGSIAEFKDCLVRNYSDDFYVWAMSEIDDARKAIDFLGLLDVAQMGPTASMK